MTRSLLLLRHGKSSWKSSALADHERPLKKRGIRDARRMALLLAELGLPDLVLTSTALRAAGTTRLLVDACGYAGVVEPIDALYMAGPAELAGIVAERAGSAHRVLVVGHNPGLEDLVEGLTGSGARLPTAALAHVELPISQFFQLELYGRGTLRGLWRPRQLD